MERFARCAAAVAVVSGIWCSTAWAPPRHADLRLALRADRPHPAVGEAAVFTAAVHNNGPDSALETIVEAQLPEGTTLLRATASRGRCTGATCNLGTMGYRNLAHDARANVRYVVRVDRPGALTASAHVSSATLALEILPENNTGTVSVDAGEFAGTHPTVDLTLSLVAVKRSIVTVRVLNLGPDAAERVGVGGKALGRLDVGDERVVSLRFAKPGRKTIATTGGDRLSVRVR
jgi:uncharacterized repeat protein (TIGR01451 family)